ncbi:MAG TPA: Hpt domain-containing protein [Candidatus Competibacteraceae bacterium]|nr:Hpt domain-containing protein [Candidatus Competibacteraceae bacterium]HRZ06337.1 Hpt domain-containing protein [Candidatus Competibacteraceae bacterium]HSA45564.1 Hpt domain-containing protein [Candidatus Competibacteraceae bacterium]
MITSRRITDNPLGFLKDDLLLALRRIQINLDACDEEPADSAALEAMVDAIDQVRNPLAVLEHRDAVALLDEMRATVLEGMRNVLLDTALLQQAAQQLTVYLETYLSPGNRQASPGLLMETTTALRQARQSDAAEPDRMESSTGLRDLRHLLERLQRTVAEKVEKAAEEAVSWEALQEDLPILRQLIAERGWNRATQILERLSRIVSALATGGAEHYGVLVSGVCAEVLAGLSYSLESLGNGVPAATTVLSSAEAQLAQLDTLLGLPAELGATPKPPLRAPPTTELTSNLILPDLPEFDAPGAASSQFLPTPMKSVPTADIEFPDFALTPLDSSIAETPVVVRDMSQQASLEESINKTPTVIAGEAPDWVLPRPEDPSETVGTSTEGLINLIGLDNTDPEFVEVFLEEARGELAAIREQLALWRSDLTDRQALIAIRRAFHTLKGSGRMVSAMAIGDFAWEFESLLNQVLEGSLPAHLEIIDVTTAAVETLSPLVGAAPLRGNELETLAALAAQARALPQSLLAAPESASVATPERREPAVEAESETMLSTRIIAPDMDAEFVEVFLEEAHGELAVIREQLVVWRANFEDRQALTILRRAFHTLKGSGRVVGATAIGDFAWCFENLLNQIVNGTVTASPAMADLLDEATAVLDALLSKEALADEAFKQLPGLTARAEALSQAVPAATPPLVEALEAEASIKSVAIEVPPPEALPVEGVTPVKTAIPEPVMALAIDVELAQVFQYEAAEILDASDAILQRLGAEPGHTGLLNDLRRGMHTLKGSSRMAGIMTVGDLAHAAESVLDALGKGLGQATPVVLDTLQHALDRLNQMLAEAASGVNPAAATELIHDLHRLADTVTTGEQPDARPVGVLEPAAAVVEPVSFRAMTELDQELVQVFQIEAGEILDSSDTILQQLRGQPDSVELLNDLRREMHTLKGSSRMAGFMTVGDVAHAAEAVLDALGKGVLKMSALVLDQVQSAMDGLHQMLAGILSGVQPVTRPELINALHDVLSSQSAERLKPAAPAPVALTAPMAILAARRPAEPPAAAPTDAIRVSAALLNTLVNQMGESSIFRARIDQGISAMGNNLNDLEQTITRLRRQVTHLATQAEARIQSRQDQGTKAHQQEFDPLELDRFTELQQVSRSLMEIADDLGNVGNTLGEHAREITTLLDQQGKVNKEIQQGLMRTGMVRFGSVIPRLRRVVRQASQDLGKRAELLVGGEEAEVDRTVLESMLAPLEHMLRNSLAHGIEAPEQRRTAGKPEIGTIALSLRREGAELVLELNDDGAGLNFAAIRTKGEEKGLLLPGQPATPEELIALLLRPGFSTAVTVTQVSGRGVGMDVVNEAIRAMRGALLIQTDPGQGTRFIIRLPFSLAVTQALLVQAGEGVFAIPLLSIEVVTRLKESEFQAYLTGEPVQHPYSDRHYPVHNLGILVSSEHVLPFEEVKDRRPPTLLFRSAEASAALQVEAVMGNQEIIVKPISPQFNGVPGISGATVLGDGRVVVVLELAALVRNIGSQRQKQMESRALRAARQEARQEKFTIMVIDDSITMRKVTARILERHNIHAITAKDGLDAVAMLQTQVPDLAILDIEMPRMDGFEVVAHVRNQSNLRHLPIIMVTSRSGEKHRERAMSLGVNDYLTKPYQEDQLMESIRNILGERALDLMT